ncbi:MAG: hypothetical protein HFJ98_06810 [Eubacterium sp.]|nr:hypothetical protein [Eubacterium sp.]
MYQKLLKYFLESNLYFIESVDMILWFMRESSDELETKLAKYAFDKLGKQGGRYTLQLKDNEIKKYLFYLYEEKSACVIFLLWIGLSKKEIKGLTSYRGKDCFNKCIEVLKKSRLADNILNQIQ